MTQDDFSESSEVSTYLDGVSSAETSQSNLTETTHGGIPEVVVTSEFACYRPHSPHKKLAATFSAPPTFSHRQFAPPASSPSSGVSMGPTRQSPATSDSDNSGSKVKQTF